MILKVNRPKAKTASDLFHLFGRVTVKKKRIYFVIGRSHFDTKHVKNTLTRRFKVPRKLLIKKRKKRCDVVMVLLSGERWLSALKMPRQFYKFASRKYMLPSKFPRVFNKNSTNQRAVKNMVDLKIFKIEPEETAIAAENEKIAEDMGSSNQFIKDDPQFIKKFARTSRYDTGIKMPQCIVCKKMFKHETSLRSHIKFLHSSKKSECDYCGKCSKNKKTLLKHIVKHTDKYKCSTCGFRGGQRCELLRHKKTHNRSDDLKCKLCGTFLRTKKKFEIHLHNHPVCNVKCPHSGCDRAFISNGRLKEHMLFHINNRPYKCIFEGCDKSFRFKVVMMTHQSTHTTVRAFKCTICDKSYKVKSDYFKHVKKKHNQLPEKSLQDILEIKAKNLLHAQDEVKALLAKDPLWYKKLTFNQIIAKIPIGLKLSDRYQCIICNKILIGYFVLKTHIQVVHFPDQREFCCDLCGKHFKTKGSIFMHMIIHSDKFKCPKCTIRCRSSKFLRQHLLTHDSEKNYKCLDCNQSFKTQTYLRKHQLRKAAQKTVMCLEKDCGKGFKTIPDLKLHMKSHQTELLFECSHKGCDERFRTKDIRSTHLRIVHLKINKCSDCGIIFKCSHKYVNHMKKIHNINCKFF